MTIDPPCQRKQLAASYPSEGESDYQTPTAFC